MHGPPKSERRREPEFPTPRARYPAAKLDTTQDRPPSPRPQRLAKYLSRRGPAIVPAPTWHAIDAALQYAARGWPVFPVSEHKRPLTDHGFYDGTVDPKQIEEWWSWWPGALPVVRPDTDAARCRHAMTRGAP
jgi:bifunctional DNA primase/polymerase-like protein